MSGVRVALNFAQLVGAICDLHGESAAQANRAINTSLTLRNWVIGAYVEEYERQGVDRAQYGERMMDRLAQTLTQAGIPRCDRREIYRYRQFYLVYPQIVESLSPQFLSMSGLQVPSGASPMVETPPLLRTAADTLVSRLSFSHISELLRLEDGVQRYFYEWECIQGGWSVRELKRQVASLYYERCGLSSDKKRLTAPAQPGAQKAPWGLAIRDPYIFDFLGLKPQEVMGESQLEDQLIANIEALLLEMGQGFCFEARQKRILIGDDNPPIGPLICTRKNNSLAEYALAGMDNQLFVSKYQLELPRPDAIARFLSDQLREAGVPYA